MDLREHRSATGAARHPWETVRASFFGRVLRDARHYASPVRVLDIGAGDGYVAREMLAVLPAGSDIICVDTGYADDQLATFRDTALPRVRFSRSIPDGEAYDGRDFDLVVLLDVLEHVSDDHALLDTLMTRVRPGGQLLISVPAYQSLFTERDIALGHYRRYSEQSLRALVETPGLAVRRTGGLFCSLLVPRAGQKMFELGRGKRSRPNLAELSEHADNSVSQWPHGRLVTRLVTRALELDAWVCEQAARYAAPSVGLSMWALCERVD